MQSIIRESASLLKLVDRAEIHLLRCDLTFISSFRADEEPLEKMDRWDGLGRVRARHFS
jgi:hypothetical protein